MNAPWALPPWRARLTRFTSEIAGLNLQAIDFGEGFAGCKSIATLMASPTFFDIEPTAVATKFYVPQGLPRQSSRSGSRFLEGDSSDRAGTRAIPPKTRIISNTNSKKFMIALRCLLDESDQWFSSAAEHPGNECSQIRHNHD